VPRLPINAFINQTTLLPTVTSLSIKLSSTSTVLKYLRDIIIPLLGPLTENYPPVPLFSNLSAENSLQEQDSTFTLSYSCVQRTIKRALAFIVSVSVADYAFIMGAYNLVIIVAGGIQKRKRKDGTFPILSEENTNNIRKSLPRMYRRGKQRAAVYSRNYSFTSSDIWLK
jgi:hypothetical protein